EAVEHRRDAERPHAARRLRYLHPPHRLRLVGALKQLSPDRGPVLLQVGRQGIDAHSVDSRRALVALHLRQRFPQVLTLDNCFHRRSGDRRAFKTGFRRACFGLLGGDVRGFTLRSGAQVQLDLILLPHGSREIAALLATSTVRAFGGAPPPTMPSADFCAAVRPPYGALSLVAETRRRPPEVRSTAFAARPPDLPPRSLMTLDFAIACSLVRPGRPLYPVLVHRAAALLRASFRPRLAATPSRFANPSPPSGWIEDSHLQAVDHARHTSKRAGLPAGSFVWRDASAPLPPAQFGLARPASWSPMTCRRGHRRETWRHVVTAKRARRVFPTGVDKGFRQVQPKCHTCWRRRCDKLWNRGRTARGERKYACPLVIGRPRPWRSRPARRSPSVRPAPPRTHRRPRSSSRAHVPTAPTCRASSSRRGSWWAASPPRPGLRRCARPRRGSSRAGRTASAASARRSSRPRTMRSRARSRGCAAARRPPSVRSRMRAAARRFPGCASSISIRSARTRSIAGRTSSCIRPKGRPARPGASPSHNSPTRPGAASWCGSRPTARSTGLRLRPRSRPTATAPTAATTSTSTTARPTTRWCGPTPSASSSTATFPTLPSRRRKRRCGRGSCWCASCRGATARPAGASSRPNGSTSRTRATARAASSRRWRGRLRMCRAEIARERDDSREGHCEEATQVGPARLAHYKMPTKQSPP